ncbi:MAG: homoserine kinase [Oculatellaceae cyanobacterium Prado106]|jgi:homoserine kinase|nr:homoserine kinase [Oculatellaceae cyanobacterium Prado106]
MPPSTITITVPATTANLGPGFDCLGAALTLYNRFQFSVLPDGAPGSLIVEATGAEADRVTTDQSNLAYRAFASLYESLGLPIPAVRLAIALEVPLARGLGSSATAIVGGLLAANALASDPLSQEAVMDRAIALEGHPDNVVPALIGGCRLSAANRDGTWSICEIPWHGSITPVLAVPNFELSTAEARRVLPQTYSRADAIFNMAHLGLLLKALETGQADWLQNALQDRIHQPYRQSLIQGYEAVQEVAIAQGAYGLVISGAGPTLLAFAPAERAASVAEGMAIAWKEIGVEAQTLILKLDRAGAKVQ